MDCFDLSKGSREDDVRLGKRKVWDWKRLKLKTLRVQSALRNQDYLFLNSMSWKIVLHFDSHFGWDRHKAFAFLDTLVDLMKDILCPWLQGNIGISPSDYQDIRDLRPNLSHGFSNDPSSPGQIDSNYKFNIKVFNHLSQVLYFLLLTGAIGDIHEVNPEALTLT